METRSVWRSAPSTTRRYDHRVAPLAVFDSGVGGLSVAREIRRALPSEDLLYVADTAYCPYGDRPDAEVRERALAVGRHVAGSGAKLIVVACNTATGAALEDLRKAVEVPVVGLEPAVKIAARVTGARRIGVMATTSTVRSERLARLIRSHAAGIEVLPLACPGLADLVEDGRHDDGTLDRTLEGMTRPLREAGVDAVVLGCTHYAFVAPALARVLGPGVQLVDSAPAIARRVDHLLRDGGLLASSGSGSLRVLTTGRPDKVKPVVERLWGQPVGVEAVRI
jgi:glutamate racemase